MSPLPPFTPETVAWLRENLYGTRRVVFTDDLNSTVDKFFRNVDTRIENYVNARFQNFSTQIQGEVLRVLNTNASFQALLTSHMAQVKNALTDYERDLSRKASEYVADAEANMKISRSQMIQSVLDMSPTGPLVRGIEARVIEKTSIGPIFYASVFTLGLAGGIVGATLSSRLF